MDTNTFYPVIPCYRPPSPSVWSDIILHEGGGKDIRIRIVFWRGRRPYVFTSLSSVLLKSMGRQGKFIGEIYVFLNRLVFVVCNDRGGDGMIEMMIRLLPLEMRVLTPFYWTERGFTQDDLEEGRFSIGSFLPFSPLCDSPIGSERCEEGG